MEHRWKNRMVFNMGKIVETVVEHFRCTSIDLRIYLQYSAIILELNGI